MVGPAAKSNRRRDVSWYLSARGRNPGMPHGVPHQHTSLSPPSPHYFLWDFQQMFSMRFSTNVFDQVFNKYFLTGFQQIFSIRFSTNVLQSFSNRFSTNVIQSFSMRRSTNVHQVSCDFWRLLNPVSAGEYNKKPTNIQKIIFDSSTF